MPSDLPEIGSLRFFTDRNLGARIVPNMLRSAGWNVVTMNELYGPQVGQEVKDEEWIADITSRGFIALCADAAIARVPLQAQAIHHHGAQVFALARANAQLRGADQGTIFLQHQRKIQQFAKRGGPYACSLGRTTFREMSLDF